MHRFDMPFRSMLICSGVDLYGPADVRPHDPSEGVSRVRAVTNCEASPKHGEGEGEAPPGIYLQLSKGGNY